MTYQHSSRNPYRSKGEEKIARFFEKEKIRYFYEYPLAVVDDGNTKLWHPDFFLPECGLILEYFGVNGDKSYDQRTRHKMEVYKRAGIEGIFLTEESLAGDWEQGLKALIEKAMKERLVKFYSRKAG